MLYVRKSENGAITKIAESSLIPNGSYDSYAHMMATLGPQFAAWSAEIHTLSSQIQDVNLDIVPALAEIDTAHADLNKNNDYAYEALHAEPESDDPDLNIDTFLTIRRACHCEEALTGAYKVFDSHLDRVYDIMSKYKQLSASTNAALELMTVCARFTSSFEVFND